MQTRLTVVAGRPGSGKTTLAHALAGVIRCPLVSRDQIKEGYINSLASMRADQDEMQRHANRVFFETIQLLLRNGITLVAEAAFQHKLWAPILEPLRALAEIRIVACTLDAELARSRHIERGLADPRREWFHPDPTIQAARERRQLPIGSYDPPHLDVPTLNVDTTSGYQPSFERIVSFTSAEPPGSPLAASRHSPAPER